MKGELTGDNVIIYGDKSKSFYDKGCFGSFEKNKLILSLTEALYLMEKERIEVYEKEKKLDFDSFIKKAQKIEPKFWVKYHVYKDIRSRGYITKTALKYGADFRVYDRGKLPGTHAKWVLFCVSESEGFVWQQFTAMGRVAHSTKKKLLIGILDAENDVTYYEADWTTP
ncbi:MAG: tRNA-intron lyase [Candidatus Nanoarchaeia archaeon]|nr:tRNA-intron lyase [Candidatus Nanoarchaeia archaeon]